MGVDNGWLNNYAALLVRALRDRGHKYAEIELLSGVSASTLSQMANRARSNIGTDVIGKVERALAEILDREDEEKAEQQRKEKDKWNLNTARTRN